MLPTATARNARTLRVPIAAAALLVLSPPVALAQSGSAGQAPAVSGSGPLTAGARMVDGQGRVVGSIAFVETPNGLLVQVRMTGLTPGPHGFHIHEAGRCDPPDFTSAGGHFAPRGNKHGLLVQGGPHAGDLPNIVAAANGEATVDVFTDRLTLRSGAASLMPPGSRAVVVHATPDDYASQPSGNAGGRVACGVIDQTQGP